MILILFKLCVGLILLLLATGVAIRIHYPLPPLQLRSASYALVDTADTPLGRGVQALRTGHENLSGLHMLDDEREAFAARILLAQTATRSIDVQYYIWHGDMSGTLMLEAMREAADRGVRVRMLLDDNGVAGLDQALASLDHHPNMEVRLFNPLVLRWPRMLGYLADFRRLNQRMHNKSFIADNQVAIIGGRNIGDEYFGARSEGLFTDLDMMAVGPAVADVSRDFDRYWASPAAYPAKQILAPVSSERLQEIAIAASIVERNPAARDYIETIRAMPLIYQVLDGTLPLEWAPVRMVSDHPAKVGGRAARKGLLAAALREILGRPKIAVALISGYFVPTAAGVKALTALCREGVEVRVMTNSFEATDVWLVHAGYVGRRKPLLKAGVRLHEMRGSLKTAGERRRRSLFKAGSGSGSARRSGPVLRSSASTLHAKTFAVDRKQLFVGSFNFDPRSIYLNTELGFVIESPALASIVQGAFDLSIPERSYEVVLSPKGALQWLEQRDGQIIVHPVEPGTNIWQRAGIRLLSYLPIEWLL